ncbi:MAG TPA: SRPBCC family protein [Acidimicrobiales bacterium]
MPRHQFEVTAHSPAPPEAVFAVLADIPRWHEWGGPAIRQSVRERPGAPEPDGVGAVRKLGGWPVYSREEIVEFSPPSHMAYVMRSGWPVRGYRADVKITPGAAGGGGTAIHWRGGFDAPAVPGTGGALRLLYSRVVGRLARGLAGAAAGRSQP